MNMDSAEGGCAASVGKQVARIIFSHHRVCHSLPHYAGDTRGLIHAHDLTASLCFRYCSSIFRQELVIHGADACLIEAFNIFAGGTKPLCLAGMKRSAQSLKPKSWRWKGDVNATWPWRQSDVRPFSFLPLSRFPGGLVYYWNNPIYVSIYFLMFLMIKVLI